MNKFNVGDRVVCANYPGVSGNVVGRAGVVTEVPYDEKLDYYAVTLDEELDDMDKWYFIVSELRSE